MVTLSLAGIVACTLPGFFSFIGARQGTIPFEPLLHLIPALDVSTVLFPVLYLSILAVVIRLSRDGDRLLRTAQAYVILLLLRMVTMTVITLEAPADLVPLTDPITQLFYPTDVPFNKDLFFSGHTATLFLLFLAVPPGVLRTAVLAVTILIGILVLVQHVHWTIDVLAAPFAAWAAWYLSGHSYRWSTGRRFSDAGVS